MVVVPTRAETIREQRSSSPLLQRFLSTLSAPSRTPTRPRPWPVSGGTRRIVSNPVVPPLNVGSPSFLPSPFEVKRDL